MKRFLIAAILLSALLFPAILSAGEIRIFVSEFSVSGAANKDELKGMLPGLLASRLSTNRIIVVDSPKDAGMTVNGSYSAIGKIFSLDLAIKDSAGAVLLRSFEQGDAPDDLIPAINRLAQKVTSQIINKADAADTTALPLAAVQKPAAVPAMPVPPPEIIRTENLPQASAASWVSKRLEGALSALAIARELHNGEREIFVAGDKEVRLYRQGASLDLVTKFSCRSDEKILSIDSLDYDNDGNPELFVTMVQGSSLVSQLWRLKDGALLKILDNLPLYFRAISLKGEARKIYAQQTGIDADFFGDVYEFATKGNGYELRNPIKMPRFTNIFNFNLFLDKDSKTNYIAIHTDGYLIVYDNDRNELWRSNDKFGGSESFFSRDDAQNSRITGESARKVFIDQRITVAKSGQIVVPENSGFWIIGNSRSYSKNSVIGFTWNGSSLEERWRTKPSQNYLADYFLDENRKELLILEVVKKAGMIESGASSILIKKVD